MRRHGQVLGMAAALGATLSLVISAGASAESRAYFVKRGATAAEFFADRDACEHEATSLGDSPDAYSNPRYGALTAMGQAIDSDALHGGGLKKRMQAAVFKDCMKTRDWSPRDPSPDEAKALKRASPRHPEALDAWLKANEPPPPPPPPPPPTPAVAQPDAPTQPR